MKKIISLILCAAFVFTLNINVFAMPYEKVLHTDIKAYINFRPIKSYNVNGWTLIAAEDLQGYGFDVEWNGQNRTLKVYKSVVAKEITADYEFEQNKNPIGSFAFNVYETDIKTYVADNKADAFNIGGTTLIYIDELCAFGDVVWNSEKREIHYNDAELWNESFIPERGDTPLHTDNFSTENQIYKVNAVFTKDENGNFKLSGENLEHLSWIALGTKINGDFRISFSMDASHLFADEQFSSLCQNMATINYDGTILKDNADLANEHIQIYIDSKQYNVYEVSVGKGNNHMDYYFEIKADIPKEDINEVRFVCEV